MRTVSTLILMAALIGGLCKPTVADAKPHRGKAASTKQTAEALAMQGRKRFATKDFEAAAKLFMKAYAKDPKPALVYNAARAYEEAGMKGDAAGLFRLYMTIATDDEGVRDAKARLRALQGEPAVAEDGANGDKAKSADGESSAGSPGADADVQTGASTAPAAWPRWAVTGGAVIVFTTGVALVMIGASQSESAAKTPVRSDADITAYNARFDSAESKWNAGLALSAVGVGLGVWATWMHLRAEPQRSALSIQAGPRSAQLLVRF